MNKKKHRIPTVTPMNKILLEKGDLDTELMIFLAHTIQNICIIADVQEADRNETLQTFARTLYYISQIGDCEDFETDRGKSISNWRRRQRNGLD